MKISKELIKLVRRGTHCVVNNGTKHQLKIVISACFPLEELKQDLEFKYYFSFLGRRVGANEKESTFSLSSMYNADVTDFFIEEEKPKEPEYKEGDPVTYLLTNTDSCPSSKAWFCNYTRNGDCIIRFKEGALLACVDVGDIEPREEAIDNPKIISVKSLHDRCHEHKIKFDVHFGNGNYPGPIEEVILNHEELVNASPKESKTKRRLKEVEDDLKEIKEILNSNGLYR